MANVVKKAAKGWRKEMTYLYEANKQRVYYVAQKLLLKDALAEKATQWVFERIWGKLAKAEVSTEEDFTQLAVKMTAEFCKKQVEEKNPQAFFGQWDEERILPEEESADKAQAGDLNGVLAALPEMHRFILVLHNVCSVSKMKMAILFKVEHHTIQKFLSLEEQIVANVLDGMREEAYSYERLLEDLKAGEKKCVVPEHVDEAVQDILGKLSAATESKDKKLDNVFSVLLLVVGVVALTGIFFGGRIKTTLFGEEIIAEQTSTEGTNLVGNTTENTSNIEETVAEPEPTIEEIAADLGLALLDENLTYYADIEIQDYGKIIVELNQEEAPITAANFVDLAQNGFYDGLTFHRIMRGYMMQGGDPEGNGTGGNDRKIVGEFKDNGFDNDLSHKRGAISMARANDYDSASSQFFIMHKDYIMWNGYYAVFGYVTEGLDVVDAICENEWTVDSNSTVKADEQPVITSITIRTEAAE